MLARRLHLLPILLGLTCLAPMPACHQGAADVSPGDATDESSADADTARPAIAPSDVLDVATLDDASLVEAAVAGDPHAVAELRSRGPRGLELVTGYFDDSAADDAEALEWRTAIDAVAGQRDAEFGRLYWYTDLAEARLASRRSGRPILSLRMLGNLTDELSCANSRFFRTVLYSDRTLARWLEDNYVLHWSSERPVPVVSIDLGDGRRIRRTITGNSAHYVLDDAGRPIDMLPGLYGAAAFREALEQSLALHDTLVDLPAGRRAARLTRYHAAARDRAATELGKRLAAAGRPAPAQLRALLASPPSIPEGQAAAPPAVLPNRLTASKAMVEVPMLRLMGQPGTGSKRGAKRKGLPLLGAVGEIQDDAWRAMAEADVERFRLDASSVRVMARQRVSTSDAAADRLAMVSEFELLIAEDTLRNELRLRPVVHEWIARDGQMEFEELNERVYSELFLTPADDPWLGLWDPKVYDGLTDSGRVEPDRERAGEIPPLARR